LRHYIEIRFNLATRLPGVRRCPGVQFLFFFIVLVLPQEILRAVRTHPLDLQTVVSRRAVMARFGHGHHCLSNLLRFQLGGIVWLADVESGLDQLRAEQSLCVAVAACALNLEQWRRGIVKL
jgi:hypothetical protein